MLMGLAGTKRLRETFVLRNVLPAFPGKAGKGDAFPAAFARTNAARMRLPRGLPVLLMGRGPARALGVAAPYLVGTVLRGRRAVVVPHPSGVNRWWNDPANAARATAVLRSIAAGAAW